jgi:cytochrome P450
MNPRSVHSNPTCIDYDHYDESFALDPHGTWAQLRRECPVARTENYGGFYVVAAWEDIDHVLHDPELFSSFPADTPPDPRHTTPLIPMEIDPPEHRRYRKAFEPLFRPRVMAQLEHGLREHARALVAEMIQEREFDFVERFALPFPSGAFLGLLGLDRDHELIAQLGIAANQVLHAVGAPSRDVEAQRAVRATGARTMRRFLTEVLDGTRTTTPDGLLSTVLDDGFLRENGMKREEVRSFLHVLLLGGLETVTTALAFSFLHLGRRPDLQQRLVREPRLIPEAVEELLRFETSVHPTRTVTRECTLRGVRLRPGDRIAVPYGSANRDEGVFERPDEIILDRQGNRHIAFGAGNHRCLGSHLARLELRVAFEEIFRAIPEFTVDAEFRPRAFGGQTRSIADLPFRVGRT